MRWSHALAAMGIVGAVGVLLTAQVVRASDADADSQPDAPAAVFALEDVVASPADAAGGFEIRDAKLSLGPPRVEGGAASLLPQTSKLLKVVDPGDQSPLDFGVGDTLTIESWLRIDESAAGGFPYIVGKGRTHTVAGKENDANQNYALRLEGGGSSKLSFLWMDSTDPEGRQRAHRWTSKAAVAADGRWHHVVLSYTFGTGEDVLAMIDGVATEGVWDMEGNSPAPPVVDNDDVWVGGSHGAGHTFPGLIEGLAIYRSRLDPALIKERTTWVDSQQPEMPWPAETLEASPGVTRVAIADLPLRSWFFQPKHTEPVFFSDGMALTRLPHRYNERGLIADRPGASMVRLVTEARFPPGTCQILLRSLDAARVYIDGELVVEQTTAPKLNGSAHGKVYELAEPPVGVVQQTGAHTDTLAEFVSDGLPHRFEVYRLLGGDGRVHQLGEFLVAVAAEGEPFGVLGSGWQPDDAGWQALLDRESATVADWNRAARAAADVEEDRFWARRHAEAAAAAGAPVPVPSVRAGDEAFTPIDHFLLARLEEEGLSPMPLVDDAAFLRRATLDVTGRIPTIGELRSLGRDHAKPPPLDRSAVIDNLLASDEWADHWTSYWMDVLAENPALTKPTLNNSGPFRWYLHDALVDNVGMDRFVTNLIRMEGSKELGGPAGFGMASENDVPMAAKAHVLGTAFLGVEMKCARCHDAPNHPFQQSDLFAVAAMLEKKPLKVPASSSIPATPEEIEEMIVSVSLAPGDEIAAEWPFPELSGEGGDGEASADTREQLAWAITAPSNMRFREVLANRLWTRLMGRGLIDSTSDWSERRSSHPELLRFLARELLVSGDDLKHLARLIMNSAAYQRQVVPGIAAEDAAASHFRGPVRRRLTAEQVVDSLHVATGKPMRGEVQSFGQDGSQPRSTFPEMGRPRRAWQLVCTASERDRISLGIPQVDMLNELLTAYGWRPQRQDPLDRPDATPTPLQPLALANGPAAAGLLDATPEAWVTQAAREVTTPAEMVQLMTLTVLGRRASDAEVVRLSSLVSEGFESRSTGEQDQATPVYRRRISWRNHFDPLADELVRTRIAELEAGASPTRQLTADWRERAEDLQWVLVNSPEFVWVP